MAVDTPVSSLSKGPTRTGLLAGMESVPDGLPFLLASLSIADIVSAHDFGLRERLVLDLIRQLSFSAGKTEAHIPEPKFFCVALRIHKGGISEVLGALKRMLVIEEAPAGFYGFRLPWQDWKVGKRTEAIEVISQLELFERAASMRTAMRQVFVESTMGQSCVTVMSSPVPENGTAVPENGTGLAFRNPELSAIAQNEPGKTGVFDAVPDSGTGALHVHGRSGISMVHGHAKENEFRNPERMPDEAVQGDGGSWEKRFDVGALEPKSAREIMDAVMKHIRPSGEFVRQWRRRIYEDASLVWELAMEARDRVGVGNRAGWANRGYMKQKKLGRWAI